MTVIALQHVQLAMPPGGETAARRFYGDLLGLRDVPKPGHLAARGGVWFEGGSLRLHLGVEPDFRPARKAHPAFLVADLPALAERLQAHGVPLREDEPLEGFDRLYADDPFGNRIELMQQRSGDDARFLLHPQLAADTHPLADFPLCRVLLMDDVRFPWLILVPRREGVRDVIDLSIADRAVLSEETALAAEALRSLLRPYKLNVAALGNAVEQLHVHVIARFREDDAWPSPVWGQGTALPYDGDAAKRLIADVRAALVLP